MMTYHEIMKKFKEYCFKRGYKIKVCGAYAYRKTYNGNMQDEISYISSNNKTNEILIYDPKYGRININN